MRVTNCGRGIHKNEIEGVEALRTLPADWYAFTNLDLVIDAGTAREIDVILVTPRRILVVDLKKWSGKITGADQHWQLDGKDMGFSPVAKISEIERNLYILLQEELAKHPSTRKSPVPRITGITVLINHVDRSGIPASERKKVMYLSELLKALESDNSDRTTFGNVAGEFVTTPLTDPFWKQRLTNFLNAGNTSPLKPGRRKFERYVPDDASDFEHPKDIYREYSAREEGTPPSLGTLRLWDFTKVQDVRFQSAEGRQEVAGRERRVHAWLRDRSDSLDRYVLAPRTDDATMGVQYWEVYDRRKRMKRLFDWVATEHQASRPGDRIELVRQLFTSLSEFHRVRAAHLDLGSHSIWISAPTTVRLSHLFAASHPDVRSMGANRYNFLASVQVPEDILQEKHGDPLRRDIYLAGVAAHQIIFGRSPGGDPPEWNPEVDPLNEYHQVHSWFAVALDLDQASRFASARDALEAFNFATAERPTKEEVRTGLERLTSATNSQRKLFSAFPFDGEPLRETTSIDIWRSTASGEPVVVKMWKQPAWGDFDREGKRILAFLEQAAELKVDKPAGVPRVHDAMWLSDAFAIVQDWVEGESLSDALNTPPEIWRTAEGALDAVRGLEARVSALHENRYPHGDLKPSNIVLQGHNDFTLIDFLDFSTAFDGEIQNSLYSSGGSKYQRDRFAVLKIAEEIFSLADFDITMAGELNMAISTCRTKEPALSSLTPLADAVKVCLEALRSPPVPVLPSIIVEISGRNCAPGDLEAEEGSYHVRTYGRNENGPLRVHLRGAFEELEFKLDDNGKARSVTRKAISPTRIAIVERHEILSFTGKVTVRDSISNDFTLLDDLLKTPHFLEALADEVVLDVEAEEAEEERPSPQREEELDERIAEERLVPHIPDRPVDVGLLWRCFIDSEKELSTEAIALTDSTYDHAVRRHKVPMDLESGVFDFDRNDSVEVQRFHNGTWRRLGELDLEKSTSTAVLIDAYQHSLTGPLIAADQRLQFISRFEAESLKRRASAVERVLGGEGRAAGLVSIFDPASNAKPTRVAHKIDDAELTDYGLNEDQKLALEKIVSVKPLGLLQGPPGTGKTRFIAALAHYAITNGLAKNVLISSQSHEAVNTAGEALLKLFRTSGGDPSALRIGMNEEQVSDTVRPFHTIRVEQALKDRFDSTFETRMMSVGRVLGLSDNITADILLFERSLIPIARRVSGLGQKADWDDARVIGIRMTLSTLLGKLELPESLLEVLKADEELFVEEALAVLMDKHRSLTATPEKIARLRSVMRIGTDFVTSTSSHLRNFEPFLASTRQIVMGTCVGLGRASLGLISTAFDLVIVDEAARCTASELLVPLQAARWAVLVGDQAQLEPLHRPEVVGKVRMATRLSIDEIKRSDFDRVFASGYGDLAGARLKTQYRMLEPIGRVVSEAFYPDLKLRAGRSKPVISSGILPEDFENTLTWVDTNSLQEHGFDSPGGKTGSRVNKAEADAIVRVLEQWHQRDEFKAWLTTQTDAPVAIGIICMYAAQRDLLRRKLLQSPLAAHLDRQIKVGTVDSYQGKENPIVFLSLVRNNNDGNGSKGSQWIAEGFLSTPNRINVAASRAMDRLLIFGSHTRWRSGGPMDTLASKFTQAVERKEAAIIDATGLLKRDQIKERAEGTGGVKHG